jgi:hypothetical protein
MAIKPLTNSVRMMSRIVAEFHERWNGLFKVQQEVHRAAQEGIVNSDQLWGLYNRASAAVCWGGDCVGQGCAWLGVTHAVAKPVQVGKVAQLNSTTSTASRVGV